jgi:hypothetical protein
MTSTTIRIGGGASGATVPWQQIADTGGGRRF